MKCYSSEDDDTFSELVYKNSLPLNHIFGFCLLFFLALFHLHLFEIPFRNYALAVIKKWRTLFGRSDNILSLIGDMRFWSRIFYFACEHMRCCCSLSFAIAIFYEFCPTLCMIIISMLWWNYTQEVISPNY